MPNPLGHNGKKPGPPNEDLRPILEEYVARGFTNPQIAEKLRTKHFNPDFYALSVEIIKKRRSEWRLLSTRGQRHTVETAGPHIENIRARYPTVGYRVMKNLLRQQLGQFVSKRIIRQYMNAMHPDEVHNRKAKRFVRKIFWTAGVNDIWSMDQHDKWRRFHLYLHIGVEPYSGAILWLKIWWTNRNPRLICSWYCDTIERLCYNMPLLTQSDPGTENYGIANAQTMIRHRQDPSLSESLQHQFRGNKGNIKPEIAWRRLRYCWSPGYEALIQNGISAGLYDPDDALERLVFQYTFIPWLQQELDEYTENTNDSLPRFNRHKVLPHGRPRDIFSNPKEFRSENFAVKVQKDHLDEARAKYAPPDHPVFHLVPPPFAARAAAFYHDSGPPNATHDNVWDIYLELLQYFLTIQEEEDVRTVVNEQAALPPVGEDTEAEGMELLPFKRYRVANPGLGGGGITGDISGSEEEVEYNYWTVSESSSDGE